MAHSNATVSAHTADLSSQRAQTVKAAATAILFGMILLFGAAFAGPSAIHNAAHDSRHSIAVPCH